MRRRRRRRRRRKREEEDEKEEEKEARRKRRWRHSCPKLSLIVYVPMSARGDSYTQYSC